MAHFFWPIGYQTKTTHYPDDRPLEAVKLGQATVDVAKKLGPMIVETGQGMLAQESNPCKSSNMDVIKFMFVDEFPTKISI